MEKCFFIDGEVQLFGMLFCPETRIKKNLGFVIIHPFAEEKKSAHRTLVDLARSLYQEGFPTMLFDLRGCGDSQGDFGSVRLENWLNDIDNAVQYFRESSSLSNVGLIGVRLGAYLSGYYAALHKEISICIWIEPVLKPIDYLRKSLRQKLVKELCTDGKVTSSRDNLLDNLRQNNKIDFDGHELGADLFRDLEVADNQQILLSKLENIPVKLSLSISMNGRESKTAKEVKILKPSVKTKAIRMELFWNRVDTVDAQELISNILDYLKGTTYE